MSAVGIIPARYQASRFPGKPLAPIAGVPMLRRVFEGARRARRLREVVVATDDPRVVEACRDFGARAFLTAADHATGTDRVAELARRLDDEWVVNIQGDEPLIEGDAIDAALAALQADPSVPMATLAHASDPEADADPHRVKVVLDRRGFALYFSRAAIPAGHPGAASAASRSKPGPIRLQHVGLYAYRRDFLLELVELPRTPAEQSEGLEQLRALEHGHRIRVVVDPRFRSFPVDVPEDVRRVEAELSRRAALAPA